MFLGLRTVIYPAADLAASKAWFTKVVGVAPYFDEPFYVGFNVAGYELGLIPTDPDDPSSLSGPVTYWGVANADDAYAALIASGASPHIPVSEVGDGIRTASVLEPNGGMLGIIENPHFALPDAISRPIDLGPGR